MNGESSREVSIFSDALDVPLEERADFLTRACAGDEALRRKVERLLATHRQVGDFLEDSPSELASNTVLPSMPGEKPGDRIGHYTLLQQIGEGGCGVVYMAEQTEPVRRRVALKIIKPGMDTKAVISRFEAERQALALMDHPNIAKVFDAGATASGRPYFVMELVRGLKITDYCDQHSLATRERLQLFIQVCQAVQHAHQKGIIHRDIKPSNILVTVLSDGSPSAVIIDFGIAKAITNQRLTEKTVFTAFQMLIGTPAYMSPEQTAFAGGDVDTRTDIYSLGVLLYELLTGATPFETEELLKAGIEGVCRLIQTREAVPPSTRLKIMLAADLDSVSRRRQTAPISLIRSVRGDLDWIVMKALEKERARRYATANEYALDIRRYLNGEAVSARPPSSLYKLQKLVSRNKLLFAALAAVLVSCLAGLIATSWSLSREKKARREADLSRRNAETNAQLATAEAARSGQVTKLLEDMFQGVGPSVAKGRDTAILREMLDRAADRVEKEMTNQPAVKAEMLRTIGSSYAKIGNYEKAKGMEREALAIYQKNGTTNDENMARALFDLGTVRLISESDFRDAREDFREALRIRTRLFGSNNMDVVETTALLGWTYLYLGSNHEAFLLESNALRAGRLLTPGPSTRLVNAELGLAKVSMNLGSNDLAESIYRTALGEEIQLKGEEDVDTATVMHNLGLLFAGEGKLAEAESFYQRCAEIRKKAMGAEDSQSRFMHEDLAVVYQREGKFSQAADIYGDLITNKAQQLGGWDRSVVSDTGNLAWCLDMLGKPSEAKALRVQFQAKHPDLAGTLLAIEADQLAQHGRIQEAEARAIDAAKMNLQDPATYHTLAPLIANSGDPKDYEELCGQIVKKYGGTDDFYTADRMAKDCLILPRPGTDFQPVAAMANFAVSAGKEMPAYHFFIVCKALAEFRQEHWSAAAESAGRAARDPFPYSKAEALAILAMSQWRMNRPDESRQSLARCREEVHTHLLELDSPDLGRDWRDCIIARLLLREATVLIQSGAP